MNSSNIFKREFPHFIFDDQNSFVELNKYVSANKLKRNVLCIYFVTTENTFLIKKGFKTILIDFFMT